MFEIMADGTAVFIYRSKNILITIKGRNWQLMLAKYSDFATSRMGSCQHKYNALNVGHGNDGTVTTSTASAL